MSYSSLEREVLLDWMVSNWKLLLGYCPKLNILMNNWFCFQFLGVEDLEKMYSKNWIIGKISLMLKK